MFNTQGDSNRQLSRKRSERTSSLLRSQGLVDIQHHWPSQKPDQSGSQQIILKCYQRFCEQIDNPILSIQLEKEIEQKVRFRFPFETKLKIESALKSRCLLPWLKQLDRQIRRLACQSTLSSIQKHQELRVRDKSLKTMLESLD